MQLNEFTNLYSQSKTLRFALEPVGKTLENFNAKKMLEEDEERARDYKVVKKYIDEYHKWYIDSVLGNEAFIHKIDISEYAESYNNKSDDDKLDKISAELRKLIAKELKKNSYNSGRDGYKDIGGYSELKAASIIPDKLCDFVKFNENAALKAEKMCKLSDITYTDRCAFIKRFDKFTTYFNGYEQNRENMYSDEAKSTAIAYRCIDENLPKFLDNIKIFDKIKGVLVDEINSLNSDFAGLLPVKDVTEVFCNDYFGYALSQQGIDLYNGVIGGYTFKSEDRKVQGLNEYINLYNQKNKTHLPKLKSLFKQILSDRTSLSFIPESFNDSAEVKEAVTGYIETINSTAGSESTSCLDRLVSLFEDANTDKFDLNGIFVKNERGNISDISQKVFGSWSVISDSFKSQLPPPKSKNNKDNDDYYTDSFKKVKLFSLSELQQLGDACENIDESAVRKITQYYCDSVKELVQKINEEYTSFSAYDFEKDTFIKDDGAVKVTKPLLDDIKLLENLVKPIYVVNAIDKDESFYGEFTALYDTLSEINELYDKVRNFASRKPYSKDKIKLNFHNPHFLGGWVDSKTEKSDNGTQYGGYLFRKKNCIGEYDYYIGISDDKRLFRNNDVYNKSDFERFDYYQIKLKTLCGNSFKGEKSYSDQESDFIPIIENLLIYCDDKDFAEKITDKLQDSKSTLGGCLKFIKENNMQFYERIVACDDFKSLNNRMINSLKETLKSLNRYSRREEIINKIDNNYYMLFTDILKDIGSQTSCIDFYNISQDEMDSALNRSEKPLYLFKIINKDLSFADSFAKGKRKIEHRGIDNLHTMYFKSLMSGTQNCIDIGSGEIFYRKKSITYSQKKLEQGHHYEDIYKKFGYPIIKDKRFAYDQFSLHLSIKLNCEKNNKQAINKLINNNLKNCDNNYVIGIDRGERNLLHICVIDEKGKILEQRSLNKIENAVKTTDYQQKLKEREDERRNNRKDWQAVSGIKELKEGYLSFAVREICDLVVKYNAIIAMENLNVGFKNVRGGIERSVYQKFEKMLNDKLSYLVDKKLAPEEVGGVLNALQLVNSSDFKKGNQNGIVFKVPAWLTSKIDPTTGFADMIHPKFENISKSQEFFGKFRDISYNEKTDMFEFKIRYCDFVEKYEEFTKEWIICTNGVRIEAFRNKEKNSEWDTRDITLTKDLKNLFDEYGIDYKNELKTQIIGCDKKDFFVKLIKYLKLTLQMRNSIPNSDTDYLISPVRNSEGDFYNSDNYKESKILPDSADANGAYNIARKAVWIIEQIKQTPDDKLDGFKNYSITNKDWLSYTQENCNV